MAKTYDLVFDGYWYEAGIAEMPKDGGVYAVYAGVKLREKGKVSLEQLLYVGESDNVPNRLQNHEKWDEWREELTPGQVLCFSFAPAAANWRERAEAALIFHHQPPCNTEYRDAFPFYTTTVRSSGSCALIDRDFTVESTD